MRHIDVASIALAWACTAPAAYGDSCAVGSEIVYTPMSSALLLEQAAKLHKAFQQSERQLDPKYLVVSVAVYTLPQEHESSSVRDSLTRDREAVIGDWLTRAGVPPSRIEFASREPRPLAPAAGTLQSTAEVDFRSACRSPERVR